MRAEVRQGLPQPTGGKKEYTDEQGRVVQVYEWFGDKLHLLVDVKHEVASGRDGAGCGGAFWVEIVAIAPPRGYPQPLESQPTPEGAPI